MSTYQITIPQIRALLLFAPKNDIRDYLNGVLLETDADYRQFAVATNGPSMLVMRLLKADNAQQDRTILDRASIDLLVKHPKAKSLDGAAIRIVSHTNDVNAELHGVTQPLTTLDGRYPDWRQVIPAGILTLGHRGVFDPALAKLACDARRLLIGRAARVPLPYSRDDPGSPLVFPVDEGVIVVMMPLREQDEHGLNAFGALGCLDRAEEVAA